MNQAKELVKWFAEIWADPDPERCWAANGADVLIDLEQALEAASA